MRIYGVIHFSKIISRKPLVEGQCTKVRNLFLSSFRQFGVLFYECFPSLCPR